MPRTASTSRRISSPSPCRGSNPSAANARNLAYERLRRLKALQRANPGQVPTGPPTCRGAPPPVFLKVRQAPRGASRALGVEQCLEAGGVVEWSDHREPQAVRGDELSGDSGDVVARHRV